MMSSILIFVVLGILGCYLYFLCKIEKMKIWIKLPTVILYSVTAYGIGRLWDTLNNLGRNLRFGKSAVDMLNSFIANLEAGDSVEVVIMPINYLNEQLSFVACVIGVMLLITSALLAVNRYKKSTWIIFAITPVWILISTSWYYSTQKQLKNTVFLIRKQHSIIDSINECLIQNVEHKTIIKNLTEARDLIRPTYESTEYNRKSIDTAVDFLVNANENSIDKSDMSD